MDWPIDWTLTGATILRGTGSNGNEGVVHILESCKTVASLSDYLVSYSEHTLEEVLLCRDVVSIFYSPSWLDWNK